MLAITAEVGAGKPTAIRALDDPPNRTRHLFAYIRDSRLTPSAPYRGVRTQLGVAPPSLFHGGEAKPLFERTLLEGSTLGGWQHAIVRDRAHVLTDAPLREAASSSAFPRTPTAGAPPRRPEPAPGAAPASRVRGHRRAWPAGRC
ncbi:hypothetical protein caldi_14530 [Caldinitratiruptor microaerophilus]|uniref:Uncharacterized protein n=1 Tax=Caldinitratiruptor microaerophilus TaxID=671077 RepID=A0AA35G8F1_9FIRM|nr:hypothetical protein caldi_14530 [Caldinitratiruptor microaerophilus]